MSRLCIASPVWMTIFWILHFAVDKSASCTKECRIGSFSTLVTNVTSIAYNQNKLYSVKKEYDAYSCLFYYVYSFSDSSHIMFVDGALEWHARSLSVTVCWMMCFMTELEIRFSGNLINFEMTQILKNIELLNFWKELT